MHLFGRGNGSSGPWLGGFQPDGSSEPSGGFQWSDGEPFNYTNGDTNQPNDSGGGQQWIHFSSSGRWDDLWDVTYIVAYVAEWSNEP